jgi:ketosteroid isomerase-like protein
MRSTLSRLLLAASLPLLVSAGASAQSGVLAPSDKPANSSSLLSDPADSPGLHFLLDLEAKFARATAEGGGKAFASWFASDAVSLSNRQPPEQGHDVIAGHATWSPQDYQLQWTPDGGQMGPSGDMGYTWGHYSGHSRDKAGAPIVTTGRYITVWKRQPDGTWKVILDASNEGPALDCCKLP